MLRDRRQQRVGARTNPGIRGLDAELCGDRVVDGTVGRRSRDEQPLARTERRSTRHDAVSVGLVLDRREAPVAPRGVADRRDHRGTCQVGGCLDGSSRLVDAKRPTRPGLRNPPGQECLTIVMERGEVGGEGRDRRAAEGDQAHGDRGDGRSDARRGSARDAWARKHCGDGQGRLPEGRLSRQFITAQPGGIGQKRLRKRGEDKAARSRRARRIGGYSAARSDRANAVIAPFPQPRLEREGSVEPLPSPIAIA